MDGGRATVHTGRADAERLEGGRSVRRGRLRRTPIRSSNDSRPGGRGHLRRGTPALRRETHRLIGEGHPDILLNLTRVRYVDSSGLGEMEAAQTAARRAGGQVALLGPSLNVRELFEVTRLVAVFDIYADEAGAVRGMGGGRD